MSTQLCGLSRNFLNFKAYPYLYVQISLIKLSLALKCRSNTAQKHVSKNLSNKITLSHTQLSVSLIICTGNRKLSTIYALDSTKHLVAEAKASVS